MTRITLGLLACLSFCLTPSFAAAPKNQNPPAPKQHPPKFHHPNKENKDKKDGKEEEKKTSPTVIKSVSTTSITIGKEGDSKGDLTYSIDQGNQGMGGTEVTIEGVRATLQALKPGMIVSISATDGAATTILARNASK